jgi:hypothetical protein
MPSQARPSTTLRGYGPRHRATRRGLEPFVLAGGVDCARCGEPISPGEEWHLGHTDDRTGYTGPEHARCNVRAGAEKATRARWYPPPPPEQQPEPAALGADDPRWRRSWLEELLDVPADAVWPRYMTVPHPAAGGSLGEEFIGWAEARSERRLRWWQRLVATRLLETDADGRLVWETLLLTMARQLGKSWLLRELLLWRMHQTPRFGEPQDVLHTGKDLQVVKEVMRPALPWASHRPGYKVSRGAGDTQIEWLEHRSRWLLRAKTAVYGYSVSIGAVDEAWKVKPEIVDEGLAPTMVEREQPQLWLISTAHREATALMLARRKAAIDRLEAGDGDLLIEWSTPRACELDDVAGWRAASPHWTPRRERLIRRQFDAAQAGEGEVVEDEADPVEAFRAQWLNQWPNRTLSVMAGDPLLPAGLWAWLAEPGLVSVGPVHVAAEDHFGRGAAVAACVELDAGRFEVDGWLCDNWNAAMESVEDLGMCWEIRSLLVGASLLTSVPDRMSPEPQPAGGRESRLGLPLLRELAAAGRIVHDPPGERTEDLDRAVMSAQVKELQTGLAVSASTAPHLVRALAWAVGAAHARVPEPVIY